MKNAVGCEAIDKMITDAKSLSGRLNTLLKGIEKEVSDLKKQIEKSTIVSAKVGRRPRITSDDIDRIKSLSDQGYIRRYIAKEVGCHVRQIGNYLTVANYEEPLRSAILHNYISFSYSPEFLAEWGKHRIESEFSSLLAFAQLRSNSAANGKNGLITRKLVKAYEAERNKPTPRRS